MHLLYLDDSGSPQNTNETYFVLGGISVPETSLRWLAYQLEEIANKLCPDNPAQVEFHAAEIFREKNTHGILIYKKNNAYKKSKTY